MSLLMSFVAFTLGSLIVHLAYQKRYVKQAKEDILAEMQKFLSDNDMRITIETDISNADQ